MMQCMAERPRILIVEHDPATPGALLDAAAEQGCTATLCTTWAEGLDSAAADDHAVIVMDRMLPGGDGIDAIARMRAAGSAALVLVVSALGTASSRVEGLEKGADDYLAKPFDAAELRARLRALLRRHQMQTLDNDLSVHGDVQIRLKARTVHVGRTHVPLSPTEFRLLGCLAANAGEPVTRMQLLAHVWNLHFDPQTNVVDVHVGRLRRKLESAAGRPLIHTARGVGYVFAPDAGPGA